ncbi:MAG: DUF3857 domain-containing protein [Planctomycetes bacterium]|nr:DUF3857 domain-containing protein [Planctomycetota bacterium]
MHKTSSNLTRRLAPARSATRGLLLTILCVACVGPLYAADPPDAVIELWEQHWTLEGDGCTVYHEKKHVRLNNDRAYGEFADPRITYNIDVDKLEVSTARVRRADGTYVEAPDYAHVAVSPNSSAGWPAFANIQQHIVVMSGIEPGCVVELEYRITSPPWTKPNLAADVRLDHQYPVREHVITIQVPQGTSVVPEILNLPDGFPVNAEGALRAPGVASGSTRSRWTFKDLPAAPSEPHSAPWQSRCARLVFSTARSPDAWAATRLGLVKSAADESDLITKLATEWTADLDDPSEKLRALQEKLAATFNFVEFDVTWRPAKPRAASEVLRSSHGLPFESAALLLALARAAGVTAQPGLLVADHVWNDKAPQEAFVAADVVVLEGTNGLEIWDPHRGRIYRYGHWAGHTLLRPGPGGKVAYTKLPAWTEADESRCSLRGKIAIADNGDFSGTLALHTSGLFVSPEGLRTDEGQRARVRDLVARLLPGAKVDKLTVRTMTDTSFEADVDIKSTKPLEKLGDCHQLGLAADAPFQAEISLPLAHSQRSNPVYLAGPCDEQIELTVKWPEKWSLESHPPAVSKIMGQWGFFEQGVAVAEHSFSLTRHTRVTQRELDPAGLLQLRGALNELRTDYGRTLLLKP